MQKKPVIIGAGASILAFLVGIGAGAASGGTSEAVAEPTPAVTVTAAPEVREKLVEVTKTPASCRLALDLADQGFRYAGDGFAVVGEIFSGLQQGNLSAIPQLTDELQSVQKKQAVIVPEYQSAKANCRASK